MYPKLIVVDGWTRRNADIKDGVSVNIIGESLSPDRVFDFPEDEPEPHPAYDFFAPGPLPGYAAMVDEPMVVPAINEVAEPVAEAEEQMAALVMDMEEDLAALFGENDDFEDDDFSDDDFEEVEEEEVWVANEEWLMAPITPPPMPVVQPLSVYVVGGPSTAAAEGPSFPYSAHGLPIPPSTMVQQRDAQIQQLQTMVSKTSSHESTLMQCIMGLDRRLAELEIRPPGPQ
nr:hypothetical protein [Tanacetum cinerariifolium]